MTTSKLWRPAARAARMALVTSDALKEAVTSVSRQPDGPTQPVLRPAHG